MRADIKAGAKFPDYELPDQEGNSQSLSALQGNDPLVLLLARGSYCPKEDTQHQWLADMQLEFAVGYARLVTISTDTQLESKEWRQRLDAHWPFLSDEHRTIQKDLEYNGYWYWGRPTPDDVRQELRAITQKCRPDWDLSNPDVRRRWESGDRRSFYPYAG